MGNFNRRRLKVISFLGAGILLLSLGFQNCSQFSAGSDGSAGFVGLGSNLPSLGALGVLTPDVATIPPTGTLQISQSNGSGSGSFQLVAGSGSVDPQTGVFTPAADATDAIVGRPDSSNNWSYAFIKVSSTTAPLALSPVAALVAPSHQVKFGAAGGTPPYTYAVSSGRATLNASTGLFTAGYVEESLVVTVTDATGQSAQSSVQVMSGATGMAVLHAPNPMIAGKAVTFIVAGGTAPYTMNLLSGGGVAIGQTYTPPFSPESASFQFMDSKGQTISLLSSVIEDPSLSPVVAGTKTFSTPGTYTFTVPNFHTLTVMVKGAGGGGGGMASDLLVGQGFRGGSAGGVTSFAALVANGGSGGSGWINTTSCGTDGAAGTASGGSSNVTGGGNPGGAAGNFGYGPCGGAGGAGGRVDQVYTRADLTPGTTITIVVGAGGLGSNGGNSTQVGGQGAAGTDGTITITIL